MRSISTPCNGPGTRAPSRRTWHRFSLALAAVACLGFGAGSALAQTCAAPQQIDAALLMQTSDTCGGETIASICEGQVTLNGPVGVLMLRIGAGASGQLEIWGTEAGFSPVAYLLSATQPCGSGTCHEYLDPGTPLELAEVVPGDYYLFVAASELDASGACGNYVVSVNGDLGAGDPVYRDGFDPGP